MKTLVILPTYNEGENIEPILTEVTKTLDDANILVIDDSSEDGTAEIVKRFMQKNSLVKLISRPKKQGLGSAYLHGFKWGLERGFECFVEMDSDFSHDPHQLPELIRPISEGYDLVIGSRYIPGGVIPQWSLARRIISKGGNVYARLLLGVPIRDLTSGYRAFSARAFSLFNLDDVKAEGYGFQIELALKVNNGGGKVTEVPIRFIDRQFGTSKMSSKIVLEAFVLVTKWGLKRLVQNFKIK